MLRIELSRADTNSCVHGNEEWESGKEKGCQEDEVAPLQAATPGQIVVLYDKDVCLGGGAIHRSY
jgi:tRNA U34 2-thiouridine synthase MnmA/TrmU